MSQAAFRPHGLIWKETRLVVPLILMLVGAAVLLVTLWSLMERSSVVLEYATQIIPMMWPLLYAAGAGAILVSQERENRTLWWFVSLPISPQRVFWTKTAIAFVGLGLMLCLIALFAWMNGRLQESELSLTAVTLFVFITMAGIFTSWRVPNTFASLMAVVPITFIPILLPVVFVNVRAFPEYLFATSVSWCSVIGAAILLWLAYRAAMKTLLPSDAPGIPLRHNSDAWREPWQSTIPITPSLLPPVPERRWHAFDSSLTSLVWQSWNHNRLARVGLISLALVGFAFQLLSANANAPLLGVALSCCWLGVFAFTGDGSAKRLRFLADRGVSSTRVWLGLHLLNLSFVAITVLIYGVILYLLVLNPLSDPILLPSIGMAALVLWTLYGVSQWTSQLIRILPAAAVLAPLIGSIVIYWLGFAATEFGAPLWLVVLCTTIPFFATWWTMRAYMDEASQLRVMLLSIVPVIAMCVIPTLPAARTIATWPSMPASTRASLLGEAELVVRSVTKPQSMMLKGSPMSDLKTQSGNALFASMSDEEALKVLEDYSFAPEARLQLGNGPLDNTAPLAVDMTILENSLAISSLHVLQYQSDTTDEDTIERLGAWIRTLTTMAKRFRASPRWLDQEAADVVEIWLTQTLSDESMKPIIDRDFSKVAREMLADSESRSKSRRRAVLASWHGRREGLDGSYLGGLHEWEWTSSLSRTISGYVRERNIDAVVDRAIRLIEAGERGESTVELRRELHDLTAGPEIAFEDGPYSDRLRASLNANMTISTNQTLKYPANQWYAGWESDAKKLKP